MLFWLCLRIQLIFQISRRNYAYFSENKLLRQSLLITRTAKSGQVQVDNMAHHILNEKLNDHNQNEKPYYRTRNGRHNHLNIRLIGIITNFQIWKKFIHSKKDFICIRIGILITQTYYLRRFVIYYYRYSDISTSVWYAKEVFMLLC